MTKEELRIIVEDRFLDVVEEILEPSPEKVRLMLEERRHGEKFSFSRKVALRIY